MNYNDWMNDPKISQMDPVKVELMKTIASQSQGKNMNEMAPLLMAAVQRANSQGVSFSPDEMNIIIDIMKNGKSKEEQKKIDNVVRVAQNFMKNKK